MKWPMRILCWIACFGAGVAVAQLPLTQVDFVNNDLGLGWFQDTVKRELWLHEPEGWHKAELSDVVEVVPCGRLVTVKAGDMMYIGDGFRKFREAQFTHCADSFLAVWNGYVFAFMMTDSAHRMQFPAERQGRCWHMDEGLDTLQGGLAACLAPHLGYQPRCEDFAAWGMMGMDGRWLIQPEYDAPFRFKNGVAEVVYYGHKRRINEKGEWVE